MKYYLPTCARIFTLGNKTIPRLLIAMIATVIAATIAGYAQSPGLEISEESEIPIDEVKFIGNERFSDAELADAVASRPSERGITRGVFLYFYHNFNRNPYCPPPIISGFRRIIASLPDGLRYFSDATAHDDADLIEELYNQHGYHETIVAYNFKRDPATKKHILTFKVQEGASYKLRALIYTGLHNLPADMAERAQSEMKINNGIIFEESKILREADAIDDALKNNGWYFSSFQREKPVVVTDTTSKTDSVVVDFSVGKRVKIGKISVAKQLNEQKPITDNLLYAVSELREGDWYSRKKVVATINALYQLGVYDFVSIDTSGREATFDSDYERFDMQIFTRYKEQREFALSPFLNRTANDNLTNFGAEASFSHRNIFGAAQNFNFFARYIWNDFQFSVPKGFSSVSSEIQSGLSLIQPALWSFDNWRVSGSGQTLYSRKFVIPRVAVNTFSTKFSLPVIFPPWVYITSVLPEFSTEVQSIENGSLIPSADAAGIAQAGVIEPLRALNRFTGNLFRLTTVTLGFNVASDKRNDFFAPSEGHLFSFAPEIAFGPLALYKKLQATYLIFKPAAPRAVFAAKIRLGHIIADSGNYIPMERLFFAGGANSVRSYGARLLFDPLATKRLPDSLKHPENIGILTGSKSLIEGSFEYRITFSRPAISSSFIASQIERMGVTFFIDYGSTYNSSSVSPNIGDILSNIAVGVGLGFRYTTPVGPFRIDIATRFYDPTSPDRAFIAKRSPLDDLQMHIGLGHAF